MPDRTRRIPMALRRLSAGALALAISSFVVRPAAAADLSACGNIHVEAEAKCDLVDVKLCDVECQNLSFEAACHAEGYAECSGTCSGHASAVCTASCDIDACTAQCDVDPPSFDCQANCAVECTGNCSAECAARCSNDSACRADCEGVCEATCQGDC